jgi:ketosteroid isomerase-like protein
VDTGQGNANVATVMSLYEAFKKGDNVTPFEIYDRDIVWRVNVVDMPDLPPVSYGHDGVREFWRTWLSAWELIQFEVATIEEIEADVVLAEIRQASRGRSSGAEVPFTWFQIWRLRDGKVIASYGRRTREDTLEAASVKPPT